jgi:hypothetical protein
MMGGTIRAEAGRDHGASFSVRLPRERRRRVLETQPAASPEAAPGAAAPDAEATP